MDEIIEPKTLRGFRDSLPETELSKTRIEEKLAATFRRYGFVPIDTPALEYAEILLGKGGGETDKQVYRFLDHGHRDVALRFDLTVPFARFMAAHLHELYLPFKRYHIGKVWRGENPQRGRYREFIQVDFDIVGVDSASADFEILSVMRDGLKALGIEEFQIHVSHRELLNELLRAMGSGEQYLPVLRAVDKLKKIGEEQVGELLGELLGPEGARRVLDFVRREDTDRRTLRKLAETVGERSAPLLRMGQLLECVRECGLEPTITLDPSITRGLDYYTGMVCEAFLDRLPEFGAICGGGRYNDLASLYTREKLPGVGASIGLDRLLSALEELGLGRVSRTAPDLLILLLEEGLLAHCQGLASRLRQEGLAVEVYPESRKLAQQLKYAEKRQIPLSIFYGEEEHAGRRYTLKDLRSRRSYEDLSFESLRDTVRRLLST